MSKQKQLSTLYGSTQAYSSVIEWAGRAAAGCKDWNTGLPSKQEKIRRKRALVIAALKQKKQDASAC